jgi:hypothetical protein
MGERHLIEEIHSIYPSGLATDKRPDLPNKQPKENKKNPNEQSVPIKIPGLGENIDTKA